MHQSVQRRAVFFVGGYDPKTPAAFFKRMGKELARFEALWGLKAALSATSVSNDGEIGTATLSCGGDQAGWTVATDFNFLVLDKIVLADFSRPLPVRLGKYLAAFADFVVTGTAFRIFARAWRFGLYFLFPFLMILLFVALGLIVTRLLVPWLGVASWLAGLAVFALAQTVLGRRWPVNHLMDLWSFSLNFIRGRRPDAEALMQRFAEAIVECSRNGRYDEILLVGHSTGGVLILDIAARCLATDPDFPGSAPNVSLLTLGSTALKAGLHPAAGRFRAGAESLAADRRMQWVEIQCLTDVINFYKSDPAAEMRLTRTGKDGFPVVRTVRVKDMLQPDTYKRIKRSFFRVHYQYIFGNTKRYWYDFFQVCCGPLSLKERAEKGIVGSPNSQESTAA